MPSLLNTQIMIGVPIPVAERYKGGGRLRAIDCWDLGIESRRGNGSLSRKCRVLSGG